MGDFLFHEFHYDQVFLQTMEFILGKNNFQRRILLDQQVFQLNLEHSLK